MTMGWNAHFAARAPVDWTTFVTGIHGWPGPAAGKDYFRKVGFRAPFLVLNSIIVCPF
jgi:hypothetical protein